MFFKHALGHPQNPSKYAGFNGIPADFKGHSEARNRAKKEGGASQKVGERRAESDIVGRKN